ncbi:hypothetical protein BUALT_Bualt03G0030900 [Buddleja alternifolia]|uniref:X8 domain-containing protein n=1 Tax=Buddleja alternifolia TaxID=168488 RepID=A0AAV6XY60_9LAMI|nr:hypothetical protein BUALT_Bualt03G0030900 [Buddleja alternifolia]
MQANISFTSNCITISSFTMAHSFLSLHVLAFLLPILLIISGGILTPINGQATGQGAWCVTRPSTYEQELMENINFACGVVNCSMIQPGGACYYPNNMMNHASVAMNLYYQKQGRHYWNCDFNKSGVIVVTDPSKQFALSPSLSLSLYIYYHT